MEFCNRSLSNAIQEAWEYFSVFVVTGPRQSGKTTLICHSFPHLPCYSMEDMDTRLAAAADIRGFLRNNPEGAIIDEAHKLPEIFSYLQGEVDRHPEKRFILSGSAQFNMMKNVTQSLAGRAAIFELLPFSCPEISSSTIAGKLDYDQIFESILRGFYPAVWAKNTPHRIFYANYVRTYLERDVRDLLRVSNIDAFHTFLRLCAGRIGSEFDASNLSNEIGVSVNTVKSWMSMLQASYIARLMPPYFENARKRLTRTPKIYFFDTGLACYLLGIENIKQLDRDRMKGHLFENFVVMEALKHRYNKGLEDNLYFYHDSNGNEVDLLIKEANRMKAIEIKSAATYSPDFESGFKSYDSQYGDITDLRAIVYNGDTENPSRRIQLVNVRNLERLLD